MREICRSVVLLTALVAAVWISAPRSALAEDRAGLDAESRAPYRPLEMLSRRRAEVSERVAQRLGIDAVFRRGLDQASRSERREIGARDPLAILLPPVAPRFGAPPSLIERVLDAIRELRGQLLPAGFVWLLVFVFRRVFGRNARLARLARGAQRTIRAYFVLVTLVVIATLNLPSLARPLLLLALVVLSLAGTQALALWIVDALFERVRGLRLPVIVRDLAVMLVFLGLTMLTLSGSGFDLSGVLTGSAILTAVLGLAFQDTLGSLASGLALQLERPFHEDEWIAVEGFLGRVVEVNWRATKIVTHRNEVIILPNKVITNGKVTNLSRPDPWHRREFRVSLGCDVPPTRAKTILEESTHCEGVLTYPPAFAVVEEYGEYAISYIVYFFITDLQNFSRIEDRVRSNIWYRLQRAGISLPYPIRMVTMTTGAPAEARHDDDTVLAHRIDAIGRIPYLAPLSDVERRSLAESLTVAEFGGGETVIRQGEAGSSLFIIDLGEVEVLVSSTSGAQPRRLAVLGPGAVFGEMSLMTGEPRSATVRALVDCTFFVIEREVFRRAVLGHEQLAEAIAATFAARSASMAEERLVHEQSDKKGKERSLEEKLIERIRSFFGGS